MSNNPKQPDEVWVSIPLSYLAVSRYKVALNIRELTTLTNQFSLKYVKGCVPTLIRSLPKELSMQYRVKCQKEDSDPAGHEVRVKFDISQVTKDTTLNDLQVRCSCTCPAFLYWGAQWHLHEQDSLEGQPRPLLQAPQERLDLRNGYMICKHVKVVSDRIIPSISKVIKNISRDLLVKENKTREEQELQSQEADEKLPQALPHEKGEPLAPARPPKSPPKSPPKQTPKQKALTQMQGPSPQEVQRRQDMLQKEEDRLMDLVMKPIEQTESVEDMQEGKPAKPKKPERSGLDMGLKPGQKVRSRPGVI